MNKSKSEIFHAKKRAKQRFDKSFNKHQLLEISKLCIGKRSSKFIAKISNRLTLRSVVYQNDFFPIVYDKERKRVVTFLKYEFLSPEEKEIIDIHKSEWKNKEVIDYEKRT